MISKLIRVTGIVFIVLVSVLSIFLSMEERNIKDDIGNTLLTYPSLFEDRFYDFRMKQTLNKTAIDKRIVLASIDDGSLHEIGRWPWPRKIWSNFIRKMKGYGAKVLAFDVFFSEPELACNAESPDIEMARAIAEFNQTPGHSVILPYSLNTQNSEAFEELPEDLYNFLMDTKQQDERNLLENIVSKSVYPIDILAKSGAMLGHIQASEDSDGIFRHYHLVANVDTLYFPSFSLLAYQVFAQEKSLLEVKEFGNVNLKLATGNLKLNERGESKIRWFGGAQQFPTVNIKSILKAPSNDQKMIDTFKDKIVFIGSTAFGAHDLRHTPIDAMSPGIFIHMNMTHMLLEGKFYRSKDKSTMISWLMLLGGTLLIILIQLFGNALIDLTAVVLISLGLFSIDTYYLLPLGYEIKLFFCLFPIISCYSWTTFFNFYLTSKDKQFLKNAFGNYISPELIDMMYKSGEPPKLGGDSGIRTAYFTDIQGFSTFSEKLSATQLVELLNEYLTEMTDILLEQQGTLDKYEGDAIIAFFGAPMPLDDHANLACKVAIQMQRKLDTLRTKWQSEGDKWPKIVHQMRMRIGINTGEMVTGNMGSKNRMNYTMMGDTVNLAARLEEAAKQYGIFIQISQQTKDIAGDDFELRKLDTIRVVGKKEPVTTYEILGMKGQVDDNIVQLKTLFHQGLELYQNQKWDDAISAFNKSLECEINRYPELKDKINPSKIYIDRCNQFKELPPPPDWNGIFTLTSK